MTNCAVCSKRGYSSSVVWCALVCLATGLLVGCGDAKTVPPPPSVTVVDLTVSGQAVTKVRTAGNRVVLLEERLNSIFEDGPQRTLAILQADGHTATEV